MFTCLNCHDVFEEPLIGKVNQAARGEQPYYEDEQICPNCGAPDSVVEAKECYFCGNMWPAEELGITIDDNGKPQWTCPNCIGERDE